MRPTYDGRAMRRVKTDDLEGLGLGRKVQEGAQEDIPSIDRSFVCACMRKRDSMYDLDQRLQPVQRTTLKR